MKILYLIIIIVLFSFMARAQMIFPSYIPVTSSGFTYLVNQNFEGAGTPAGWVGSGANFNNTTSPLDGSQDLLLNGTGGATSAYITWVDSGGTIYIRFLFRLNQLSSSYPGFVYLYDSSNNSLMMSFIDPSGKLFLQDLGGGNTETSAAMSTGTIYYVWLIYRKGTGANATEDLAFSTSPTIPSIGANHVQITTGTASTDAINLTYEAQTAGGGVIEQIDDVFVSTQNFF